jgi:hypothetical protein
MRPRRVALSVTFVVVAGLLVWLMMVEWSSASEIATVVSALAAVAAVGVAVWAALPGAGEGGGAQASRTGRAVARGKSIAVSGLVVSGRRSSGRFEARRTGDADASGGGEATSGVRLD